MVQLEDEVAIGFRDIDLTLSAAQMRKPFSKGFVAVTCSLHKVRVNIT
jgi:hypothetical protein